MHGLGESGGAQSSLFVKVGERTADCNSDLINQLSIYDTIGQKTE